MRGSPAGPGGKPGGRRCFSSCRTTSASRAASSRRQAALPAAAAPGAAAAASGHIAPRRFLRPPGRTRRPLWAGQHRPAPIGRCGPGPSPIGRWGPGPAPIGRWGPSPSRQAWDGSAGARRGGAPGPRGRAPGRGAGKRWEGTGLQRLGGGRAGSGLGRRVVWVRAFFVLGAVPKAADSSDRPAVTRPRTSLREAEIPSSEMSFPEPPRAGGALSR